METVDLMPLVGQLEDDIDDLEDILEPLLKQSVSSTTQNMTVMDKAKFHVLITYTIESLLFSYLRLQGVNAREHPVFKELTRVKQYFAKIKNSEAVPEKPTMTIDKQAVTRFIKHDLAGNNRIDLERAEREAKERAMAQLRAAQLAKKRAAVTASLAPPPSAAPPVPEDSRGAEEQDNESNQDGDDATMEDNANEGFEKRVQADEFIKLNEGIGGDGKKRSKKQRRDAADGRRQRSFRAEKRRMKKLKKRAADDQKNKTR
ncbi:hypothetical protein LOZ53_001665 [Ophidiomyces ophidiicola]|nr:hypothetical protein LOZ55_000962 [Ophidiomyces ophidiicola]KAI1990457.1 hypothetical protein LOZ51_004808 [Ophidiomyces ophidiicola]KAI1991389.1 hypothetical protein LOZ54_002143 [Ophidiomyces ophidiicola]KAI1994898.1 hypothetical protein LOZ53_001665 [Ophidiomyces ophidiicola]